MKTPRRRRKYYCPWCDLECTTALRCQDHILRKHFPTVGGYQNPVSDNPVADFFNHLFGTGPFNVKREQAPIEYRQPPEMKKLYTRMLQEGYRGLAKRFHPDAGGNSDDMILLNKIKESLEQQGAM